MQAIKKKRKEHAREVLSSSESDEWYTPPLIIDPVKQFYGGQITFDPATSELAQKWINASVYWTLGLTTRLKFDPLKVRWDVIQGEPIKMWMNPPYGMQGGKWMNKAVYEWERGRINEALILVKGDSEGIRRLRRVSIICEFHKRIRFVRPDGTQSDHPIPGIRLFYLGARWDDFYDQFSPLGDILTLWKPYTG